MAGECEGGPEGAGRAKREAENRAVQNSGVWRHQAAALSLIAYALGGVCADVRILRGNGLSPDGLSLLPDSCTAQFD